MCAIMQKFRINFLLFKAKIPPKSALSVKKSIIFGQKSKSNFNYIRYRSNYQAHSCFLFYYFCGFTIYEFLKSAKSFKNHKLYNGVGLCMSLSNFLLKKFDSLPKKVKKFKYPQLHFKKHLKNKLSAASSQPAVI